MSVDTLDLAAEVEAQIASLPLDPRRPLIVTDADEVLFLFMAGFERFLHAQDLYFDWSSYGLTGNIRRRDNDRPVEIAYAKSLLPLFFAEHTEVLEPVPGAAEALEALAERCEIVVLSNLPIEQREARARALVRHRMNFPLIANHGLKGAAVRRLAAGRTTPVFFIDDILHHHASVKASCPPAHRMHFVADPRLARLLDRWDDCHHRADTWPDALQIIDAKLAAEGY